MQPRSSRSGHSVATVWAFYLVGAFSALAVFDVPLIGLSVTAPLFIPVAFAALIAPTRPWFARYRSWLLLAAATWLGIALSFLVNGPGSPDNTTEIVHVMPVVRYCYWLMVFVVTAYFAADTKIMSRLPLVLGTSITILASMRWFEAIAWGKIGAWTDPRFLTQNNYGNLFSTFSPFLLALLTDSRMRTRITAAVFLLIVYSAAAVNGSRGSWIGISCGLLTFLVIYLPTNPRYALRLLMPLSSAAIILVVAFFCSGGVRDAVVRRFTTFHSLEDDKSYMARVALNQKSRHLFSSSPLFGVGPGRYRDAYAFLNLPEILSSASEQDLNRKSGHNSYLSFLAEVGLAGAIPFGVVLVLLIFRGVPAAWTLSKAHQVWAVGILSSFVAMTVHLWGISALTNTAAWFVYGLVVAVIVIAKRAIIITPGRIRVPQLIGHLSAGGRRPLYGKTAPWARPA